MMSHIRELAGRLCLLGALLGLCGMSTAVAEDSQGLWMRPEMAKFKVMSKSGVRAHGESDVDDQDDDLRLTEYSFDLVVPVALSARDEIIFDLGFEGWNLDTGVRLANDDPGKYGTYNAPYGAHLPNDLFDLDMGITYRHIFDNGMIVGAFGEIGSQSDELFHSGDEMTYRGNVFFKVPHGMYNAFIFFVDYNNARSSELYSKYPLPGAGYLMGISKGSYVVLGFPYTMLHFERWDRFELDATFLFPRDVDVKAKFKAHKWVSIYGGYEMGAKVWFRHDRKEDEDRLVYRDQRFFGGLRLTPHKYVYIDLGAGYAFNRFVYESEEYSHRDKRIEIDPSVYGQAELGLKF